MSKGGDPRTGRPLPGTTPAVLLSQVAYRALWPHLGRVTAVLDWHGLSGSPAQPTVAVAARHAIATSTVNLRVRAVRAGGAQVPLSPAMVAELSRRSVPGEDHLSRGRIANTLGVAAPPPPLPALRTLAHTRAALVALDVLAATGPQPLPVLTRAVRRTRRFRVVADTAPAELAHALQESGLAHLDAEHRWTLNGPRAARERYARLVAAADNREWGREEIAQLLMWLGYTPVSARGQSLDAHPLIERIGRNRYQVVPPS